VRGRKKLFIKKTKFLRTICKIFCGQSATFLRTIRKFFADNPQKFLRTIRKNLTLQNFN